MTYDNACDPKWFPRPLGLDDETPCRGSGSGQDGELLVACCSLISPLLTEQQFRAFYGCIIRVSLDEAVPKCGVVWASHSQPFTNLAICLGPPKF